jgi:phage gpG-like protein
MVTVLVEVDGEKAVERKLLRLGQAPDLRPIAGELRTYLFGVEREQFDTEGHSGSGGWAPLKPSTVARKAALGRDPRILRSTELLYRSLTSAGSLDAVFSVTSDTMVFGTRDPVAKFHHRGTRRMPQRKVIDLAERNRRALVKIIQAAVMVRAK